MALRKLLDEIILADGGDNWWKPELFQKNTLTKIPSELEILKVPSAEHENYNCFIYVFGLGEDKKFIRECNGFVYDTFFQKLIDEGLLEYTNNPQKGDYILYRDSKNYPNKIAHIGVLDDDEMVVSKWSWGPLFRHKVLDVPESYGDDLSYIKSISKERAIELYNKYKEFNKKPKPN